MEEFTCNINSPNVTVKGKKESPLTGEEKKRLPREDFKKNRQSLGKGNEI